MLSMSVLNLKDSALFRLIFGTESVPKPRRQVRRDAEQKGGKRGEKGIKERKQDERRSGQDLIQLCKEV